MTTEKTKKCPITVTILAWLYIAVGALSTAAHYADFRTHRPMVNEVVWITALGAAAVIAGVFMLSGRNWARWLAVAWIGAHVAISAIPPRHGLLVHSAMLVLFSYLLFRRPAREYFSAA